MTEIFEVKLRELFDRLGESRIMVLATGDGSRISARSMSVVIYDNKFCFQTDRTFVKYRQLMMNKNAALCCENISVEGTAEEIGRPVENARFCRLYKQHFEGSYNAYSELENEVVFRLTPKLIKMWIYENGLPYVEIYDVENQTYEKIRQTIQKGE
ncbi:pyridoxamine 5'-phosphate oxidase family protein [Ruminococcus sp.]|uniref:pyridoxamine 5'-phosphate oxidase family protein n=1 Tax=Ruminococcus sp. TaxID=41978 RepID=UPI003AB21AFF